MNKINFFLFKIIFFFILFIILILSFNIKNSLKSNVNTLFKNNENEKLFFFKLNKDVKASAINQKKILLIIGDSHSINIFNSLKINNFDSKYSFYRIDFPAFCFYPQDRRTFIVRLLNFDESYYNCSKIRTKLVNSKEFIYADYIIISNRWSKEDVYLLEKNIIYFNDLFFNKKIIFIGQNAIFKKFDIVLYKYGLGDKVNQFFFNLLDLSSIQINSKLKEIVENKTSNIIFFDRLNLVCNFNEKTCNIVNNNKLLYLDNDHWSQNGELFFGNKIIKIFSELF